MVRQQFGKTIDIHLGGGDLVFPHHENEIAQSETANDAPLARLWMHNGMVNVGGTKMSKSLGNFTTIRALLDSGVSSMTLRLFVLQAHYRKPLDFTADALDAANTGWKGLNAALGLGDLFTQPLGWPQSEPLASGAVKSEVSVDGEVLLNAKKRFIEAMDQDLNTSGALAVLFDLAKPLKALANRLDRGDQVDHTKDELDQLLQRWRLLRELSGVLGLRLETAVADAATNGIDNSAEIEAAIAARQQAKQSKDFATADRIRDELTAKGIELIDKPGGITEWRRS
tara:strand:- start:390 stop:1241 length:852 start_codon:yes stop_codon:yes gene_type:complete